MEVLEHIVELKGNCMKSDLCEECVFKKSCLPTFLSKDTALTQKVRFNRALSALTNISILGDNYMEESYGNR